MSRTKNDHTVIAVFPSMDAAKDAASKLHDWTKDNKDQVGDIGYVYMKGDKVKTKRWRKTGRGRDVGPRRWRYRGCPLRWRDTGRRPGWRRSSRRRYGRVRAQLPRHQ